MTVLSFRIGSFIYWITRTERPDYDFDQRSGAREVMEALGVMNLEGFGIDLEYKDWGLLEPF